MSTPSYEQFIVADRPRKNAFKRIHVYKDGNVICHAVPVTELLSTLKQHDIDVPESSTKNFSDIRTFLIKSGYVVEANQHDTEYKAAISKYNQSVTEATGKFHEHLIASAGVDAKKSTQYIDIAEKIVQGLVTDNKTPRYFEAMAEVFNTLVPIIK